MLSPCASVALVAATIASVWLPQLPGSFGAGGAEVGGVTGGVDVALDEVDDARDDELVEERRGPLVFPESSLHATSATATSSAAATVRTRDRERG